MWNSLSTLADGVIAVPCGASQRIKRAGLLLFCFQSLPETTLVCINHLGKNRFELSVA